MRVLSIDFGTSNTVAIVSTESGGRPLLFDGSPLLPSAVYLSGEGPTAEVLVGRDAERNARVDPSRFEPNPKRRIDDGAVLLGSEEIPTTHLIGKVLARVQSEARRQLGGEPAVVRMTHPARWGEHRRNALVESASNSGLPSPQLIVEPVAAASYFTSVLGAAVGQGRSLAIYDLGGGTFDATVVRRTAQGFEVLAEGGLPDVGGLDFDHAIIEHLGHTYSPSHSEKWQRLMQPRDGSDRRFRRMLWEDTRAAKEMLSRASQADIHLPALEVDAHLTRDELERLIRPLLQRTVHCLQTTIEAAKLSPADLVGIFLVGGSSRIPLAAHMIHSQLGVAPTTLEQPETVVAEGALRVGAPAAGQSSRDFPAASASAPPFSTPPASPAPHLGGGVHNTSTVMQTAGPLMQSPVQPANTPMLQHRVAAPALPTPTLGPQHSGAAQHPHGGPRSMVPAINQRNAGPREGVSPAVVVASVIVAILAVILVVMLFLAFK